MRTPLRALAAVAALTIALSGCGSDNKPAAESTTSASASASASATDAVQTQTDGGLRFEDMWVKAADGKMTAAFGTLVNETDKPIHVIGMKAEVAGRAELHETVQKDGKMMMQQMENGFTIEPGASKLLEPGADHLMLMDLKNPVQAGQDIIITLELEGGTTATFTAKGRTFKGAQEEYGVHGESGSPDGHEGRNHEGHDHEGHDHGEHEKKDGGN
ncbi:MAG: copper chaperone PCu(A)C [Bowdeniella nasicola]|nr:copper chaperone PCu(A)C [Bowdeniella nasicola]